MSIKKHIPNAITSLNLLCGAAGIVLALNGRLDLAFLLMLGGGLCDFLDGFSARLLDSWSPMGKELDSQADQVTFGVLPSVMLVEVLKGSLGLDCPLTWVPLLIAVFSGLRLAKFNIDDRQTTSFIGLPTPACAMICGSLSYWIFTNAGSPAIPVLTGHWFIPVMSVILSILLVSEIPMFSMKMHKGDRPGWKRISFFGLASLSCGLSIVMQWNCASIIFISFVGYIIINIIGAILKK